MTPLRPLTIERETLLAAIEYRRGRYCLSAQRLTDLLCARFCVQASGRYARTRLWTIRGDVAILLEALIDNNHIIPLYPCAPCPRSRSWRRLRYWLTHTGESWRLELKAEAARRLNGGAA